MRREQTIENLNQLAEQTAQVQADRIEIVLEERRDEHFPPMSKALNGQRDGTGKITMPDGFVYEGEWTNGEIDGMGVATYANGDVYEGMFVRGKRQGEGTIRYASGEEQSGTWEDGALTEPSDGN